VKESVVEEELVKVYALMKETAAVNMASVDRPLITAPESSHVSTLVTPTLPETSTRQFQKTYSPRWDTGVVELRLMQEATARRSVLTPGVQITAMVHVKMTKSAGVFN
jgi:hypothetical protein